MKKGSDCKVVGLSLGDGPVMILFFERKKKYNNMRAMFKSELAAAAGVSTRTLMRWLKAPYMQQQLKALPLTPKQQKLPGKLVKIICEHYVIDLD